MRIGPDLDVFVLAGKHGAAQLQFRVDLVQRRRPLQIEGRVILWKHVVAIGLLAHLDEADGVTAPFDIGDLRCAVFRRGVKHGHGNHGGQMVCVATLEEEVEAGLHALRNDARIGVPRIDGRNLRNGLRLIGRVHDKVDELAERIEVSRRNFGDGVANTIAWIGAAV